MKSQSCLTLCQPCPCSTSSLPNYPDEFHQGYISSLLFLLLKEGVSEV